MNDGHEICVTPRIRLVPIEPEISGSPRDEVLRRQRRFCRRSFVDGGEAAGRERPEIGLDVLLIQFDRPFDRAERQRYHAPLPGVAEHQEIRGNRVPQQCFRKRRSRQQRRLGPGGCIKPCDQVVLRNE